MAYTYLDQLAFMPSDKPLRKSNHNQMYVFSASFSQFAAHDSQRKALTDAIRNSESIK